MTLRRIDVMCWGVKWMIEKVEMKVNCGLQFRRRGTEEQHHEEYCAIVIVV